MGGDHVQRVILERSLREREFQAGLNPELRENSRSVRASEQQSFASMHYGGDKLAFARRVFNFAATVPQNGQVDVIHDDEAVEECCESACGG